VDINTFFDISTFILHQHWGDKKPENSFLLFIFPASGAMGGGDIVKDKSK